MKMLKIFSVLAGLLTPAATTSAHECSSWGCPSNDSPFIARLKELDKKREGYNIALTQKAGLSTIETLKFAEHVKQQFIDKFNSNYGTVKDEQYIKSLLTVHYEVSKVTNLVYPRVGIEHDKFYNTRLLRALELNHTKPNISQYEIKHVAVPGVKANRAVFHDITITPYETNNVADFVKNASFVSVTSKDVTTVGRDILTDGTEISGIFKLNDNDSGTPYTILRDFSSDDEVASELEDWFKDVRTTFENIAYDMKQLSQEDITNLVTK